MEWKHLFSSTIFQRGRQYYRAGKVDNYRKKDGFHCLTVMGTKAYTVRIKIAGGQAAQMNCNCPYAKDGYRCKHIAAAFFYMQEHNLLETDELVPLQQATVSIKRETESPKEQPYSYFDCDAMKQSLLISKGEMEQVQSLLQQDAVELTEVRVGYEGIAAYIADDDGVVGTAIGVVREKRRGQEAKVSLEFSQNKILQGRCNVPGCMHWYGDGMYGKNNLCVHQTALLILLEQHLKEYNPGDSTSRDAAVFLSQYRAKRRTDVTVNEGKDGKPLQLTLKPRLQVLQMEWKVSFKISGNKSFVIKNIADFVEQVENCQMVRFGTSTEWQLSKDAFSEQGNRYYEWMHQVVQEEKERKKAAQSYRYGFGYGYGYRDQVSEIKADILLYGRRLDDFFEAVGEDIVEVNSGYGGNRKSEKLLCREGNLKLRLTIEPDKRNGVFHGILLKGNVPELLYTPSAAYYMDETHLNRIPKGGVQELDPVLSAAKDGKIALRVGRKNLGEFYHRVLPTLREYAVIVEKGRETIQTFLPPEAAFVFYLDAEERDVTCRGEVHYGEEVISLVRAAKEEELRRDVILYRNVSTPKTEDFRDTDLEDDILEKLCKWFPCIDAENDCFCCDGDEELIYQVLNGGAAALMELGEVHVTDRFKNQNIRRRPKLSVGVSVESQLLNLSVSSEDISLKELLDVLESYRKKKRFHRLKNGDFFSLEEENESLELLSQLVESAHMPIGEFVKGNMKLPAYRALYLDKMLESCEGAYVERDRHFKRLIRDFKTVDDADFEVPASLQKVLRKYQETGYRWFKTLNTYGFGGILADDMGLGKTLQVIALLLSDRESGPSLVVTPASLVYNWGEELKRFAPELDVCLVTGTQKERREHLSGYRDHDVLVTSYDLLKRDIAEYENCEFFYEILDEAQYIKNHTTAAAKSVKVIKSRQRFALTGTPIENRLSELWSIFDFLMPGYLYSYEGFKKEFELPIVKHQEEMVSRRLKRMVAPFIMRRLKSEVLKDLPDKLEEVRYVNADTKQRQLLDGQVVRMRQMLEQTDEGDFGKNKLKILAELVRIRQLCCDPALCFEEYHDGSAKREACVELVQSAIAGEHKILLFSQFTSMLELLEQDLHSHGISYYKITGETPKETRVQLVNAYNQDDTPVFLISLKAGGTGLNLTGADVVIHYDPWWNLAVQNQATDRAHRIGQTKVVTVYKMIMKDSIEEKILMMQETKKNLADEILSGENGNIGSMSREELLELLQ